MEFSGKCSPQIIANLSQVMLLSIAVSQLEINICVRELHLLACEVYQLVNVELNLFVLAIFAPIPGLKIATPDTVANLTKHFLLGD